jgi:hypothetical protein
MPQVGKKHFAYTKAGMKAAKKHAKKTGKKVKKVKKYMGGGLAKQSNSVINSNGGITY